MTQEVLLEELDFIAKRVVDQCLSDKGFVLYSGGIDSAILATLVMNKVRPKAWGLFTLGVSGSQDTTNLIAESNLWNLLSSFRRIVREIDKERVTAAAKETAKIVNVPSISHFEDCTAFYLICEEINKIAEGKDSILLSANGPDELFCGYDRFRRIVDEGGYKAAELEITRALDLSNILRAQVRLIATHFELAILEPFFQTDFVNFCSKKIPTELKILKNGDMLRKRIWRRYGEYLSIPNEIVTKRKKAMQYSMGIHKSILSLVKRGELTIERDSLKATI